ncbi:hypothetical protein OAF75_00885 [Verrucomicrobiales bacterium]|nr:hypothetical protein [Verrucomicrobiales bacterium]
MDTKQETPDQIPENSTDEDELSEAKDLSLNWESAPADITDEIEEVAEVVVKGTLEVHSKMIETDSLIDANAGTRVSSDDDSVTKENITQQQVYVDEPEQDIIDKSKFVSLEEYREGKSRVDPLSGGRVRGANNFGDKPKFFDGRLPRAVERGVPYPQPGKLAFTSLLVLINRFVLLAAIIVLPLALYFGSAFFGLAVALPIMVVFVIIGLLHFSATLRTRCRVCSCQFFRMRRCDKHRLAHNLPLLGYSFATALHLILFKWMRCMYCGTAIRLKPRLKQEPDEGSEDTESIPDS